MNLKTIDVGMEFLNSLRLGDQMVEKLKLLLMLHPEDLEELLAYLTVSLSKARKVLKRVEDERDVEAYYSQKAKLEEELLDLIGG